jgi:type I restriction enzyme S subunit
MSSNLMRIAVNETLLRPDYLQMQLASDSRVKSQIRASVNSGGRDVANSEVLNRLRFAIPKPNEQDRIIAMSDRLAQRTNAEMQSVSKLQIQKLGLMQDLLTGKVPVKADAEVPEAVGA